jgi:hypothetical protein
MGDSGETGVEHRHRGTAAETGTLGNVAAAPSSIGHTGKQKDQCHNHQQSAHLSTSARLLDRKTMMGRGSFMPFHGSPSFIYG